MPDIAPVPEEDIRDQISRICASPGLENSPRLQDLLKHIVDEFLAGRAEMTKGYTIGKALYATDENFDSESNSIVRVEVARLRRRLAEYYMTTGSNDSLVIDIPKGSYVPKFKMNRTATRVNSSSLPNNNLKLASKNRWLITGALGLAILLAFSWRYFDVRDDYNLEEVRGDKSDKYFKGSEAEILFQQAFALLMPPEDGARLAASITLFERVIELDPDFGGGYAGKSIAFSFRILFVRSEDPAGDLRQALTLSKSAVDKHPELGLGYAALALAQSINADADSALLNIRRVLAIKPNNGSTNVIAAVALILNGLPSKAITLVSEALKLDPSPRTPFLNILSVAQYVNGDYSGAAKSIEKNLAQKGPTGPHMDVFLAATYAQMGKDFEARAMIEKLQRASPDYPVESWLGNFIQTEDELRAILNKLQSLGLSQY